MSFKFPADMLSEFSKRWIRYLVNHIICYIHVHYSPTYATVSQSPVKQHCISQHPSCHMAMDILSSDLLTSLLKVFQDGCPIEDYVEEFLNISNRVPWKGKNLEDHLLG